MKAFLFPGQGSQLVGMGSEFYKNFSLVKKIFQEADDRLSFSLSKVILEGPTEKLQLTENTQPAILTVSYSIFSVLNSEYEINMNTLKYFAGHSLGEYSALVCSGSLKFSDAIYLLHERGKAMQKAVPVGKGSMLALLGVNIREINNLIKELNDSRVCEIANDNADGQIIVSGDKDCLNSLQILLKNKKIKYIPLKVSAPFHCSLMKPAAEDMSNKINNTNFTKPFKEIVTNVTAKAENDFKIIKKLLIDQIFSTVKWRESLNYMSENGINNYIEIGPGKALSGMVKRTIKNDFNCFSVNSIDDMKKIENELKK